MLKIRRALQRCYVCFRIKFSFCYRFFAIAIPMKIKLLCSRRKVQIWALVLWLIASLTALPYLIYSRQIGVSCKNVLASTPMFVPYKCVEFCLFYLLPLCMIVMLYTRISLILWSTNSRLHEGCHVNDRNTVNETLRTRQNVVKMLIGCIFVYFVCYSPIHGLFIAMALFNVRVVPPFAVRLTFNCMAYACSAANPLMYSVFSRKFRAKFADILQCSRSRHAGVRHPTTVYAPSMSRYLAVSEADCYERERIITTTRLMTKKNSVIDSGSIGTTI